MLLFCSKFLFLFFENHLFKISKYVSVSVSIVIGISIGRDTKYQYRYRFGKKSGIGASLVIIVLDK